VRDNSHVRVPRRRITMASTRIVRRTLATAAVAALAVGGSNVASGATATVDSSRVSPGTVERLYAVCIDGAPRSPDAHERWVAGCAERAAAGLS
jgi:hypothetical protein